MKSATLLRAPGSDEGMFGSFRTDDGALVFASMELPWRDVEGDGIGDPQKSCITPGLYRAEWLDHPAHGWCYQVTQVVQRSGILIHAAGFAGDMDQGWQADLLGCISIGYRTGIVTNRLGRPQRALVRSADGKRSRDAVLALNEWGAGQPFLLQIIEAG